MEAINKHRPAFQLRPAPPRASKARRTRAFLYAAPAVPRSLPDPPYALTRFRALMERLDRWLDSPLRATRNPRGHTVWLMGAIGYRVDRVAKAVYPVFRDATLHRGSFTVDLVNVLRKPAWLEFVLRRHGLSDASPQAHLFFSRKAIRAEELWLCGAAHQLLLGDERFQALRRNRLREALGLDPSLVGIALAARAFPDGEDLGSDAFNYVWQHEDAFRTAARENPQLLPLLGLALRERKIPPLEDAVGPLHDLFVARGLKPATWRFLVRHGARWLRPAWESVEAGERTEATIGVLRVFEEAGYPAPPAPDVMRDWVDWAGAQPVPEAPGGFRSVPAAVLAACCQGALAHPLDPARRDEISIALEWAAATQPRLDKLQRRAGWPWVRRRSLEWERGHRLSLIEGPASWVAPLAAYAADGFRARAITCVEELVDTGLAFHNCLADFAEGCANGTMHVFVIDDPATGRSVAVAALTVFAAARQWGLMSVKGVCNAKVPAKVEQFAAHLLDAFNHRRAAS